MPITTVQDNWDYYRTLPNQDMYAYSPYLRKVARGNILEIGVRGGVSTCAFLLGLDDKNSGHLWSIDVNLDCAELYEHPRWTFVHANSKECDLKLPRLDVLLVDGDHSYKAALGDLEKFEPLVKVGGIIMMHDVQPDDPNQIKSLGWYDVDGCSAAWKDFVGEHPTWKSSIMPGLTGLGIIKKGRNE